ncbi:DinB family protein [Geothrix sp. 21YS21S-4]|uniref:DinB family protein n=1 Tax=Geothrix sp. 21YS21S-4 TaxID=3068889 RepID=UPI0027B92343|nr:DinB family protein [Geothrix sp. 21YS21S-4]
MRPPPPGGRPPNGPPSRSWWYHLAYWKYTVLRQLKALPKGAFPLKGSNWFPRPEADAAQWEADLALLDRLHRELRDAVALLAPEDLDRPSAKKTYRIRDLILGVAAHDLHHAGQIQLIKRLT